ncbi:bifunctional DNA primase/polymerase [Pseudonocardia oroxyli]|uniref:Bifunctional DNA primase/polymerase, N-terminal n=1 Tax=Pseudonocardia oroxyli TaxID=366584 RepID=A0A1G8AF32_PSEOR|nr:bifunctional DNA primase/polymerase [Pseudonocardia oroxyli]SDH19493.1 Bifunctional DNA primase/polymerase, N-terminal [Pseudonocardia oroxyli]
MSEQLRAALRHAARGWRVFPLRAGDKRPAIKDWEARATTDPVRIRRAWIREPRLNVGIACGPSGLVVIDLDTSDHGSVRPSEWDRPGVRDGVDVLAALAADHDEPLPWETLSTQTPSGGEHWYFSAPEGRRIRNSAGRLGWLIDVRAAGGYVVAAGSVVRGRRYRSNDVEDVAPLPPWIAELLDDQAGPRPALAPVLDIVGRRSQYAAAALRGEIERVLAASRGSRNASLNRAAFALGQLVAAGLLPDALARSALAEASAAIGLSASEADRTIHSGLSAGARQPRTAPIGSDRP